MGLASGGGVYVEMYAEATELGAELGAGLVLGFTASASSPAEGRARGVKADPEDGGEVELDANVGAGSAAGAWSMAMGVRYSLAATVSCPSLLFRSAVSDAVDITPVSPVVFHLPLRISSSPSLGVAARSACADASCDVPSVSPDDGEEEAECPDPLVIVPNWIWG